MRRSGELARARARSAKGILAAPTFLMVANLMAGPYLESALP